MTLPGILKNLLGGMIPSTKLLDTTIGKKITKPVTSRISSNLSDPQILRRLRDTVSMITTGMGEEAARTPIRMLNTALKYSPATPLNAPIAGINAAAALGGDKRRLPMQPAAQLPTDFLAKIAFPKGGKEFSSMEQADPLAKPAGQFLEQMAELMAGGSALQKSGAFLGAQRPLMNVAQQAYGKGGLFKPFAYGVANLAEGLPFSAVATAQRTSKGESPTGSLASDLLLDLGIGSAVSMIPGLSKLGYGGVLGKLGDSAAAKNLIAGMPIEDVTNAYKKSAADFYREQAAKGSDLFKGVREALSSTDARPRHQVLLEEAVKAKDYNRVREIMKSIPDTDPYKSSLESLFGKSVTKEVTEDTVLEQLNKAFFEGNVAEGRKILQNIPDTAPFKKRMVDIMTPYLDTIAKTPKSVANADTSLRGVLGDERGGIRFGSKVSFGKAAKEEAAQKAVTEQLPSATGLTKKQEWELAQKAAEKARNKAAQDAYTRWQATGGLPRPPRDMPIGAKQGAIETLTDTEGYAEAPTQSVKKQLEYALNQQGLFSPSETYHAAPTEQTAKKIFEASQEANARVLKREFDAEDLIARRDVRRELTEELAGVSDEIKRSTKMEAIRDVGPLKDITNFEAGNMNYLRNFRKVFGKAGKMWDNVNEVVIKPFQAAKGRHATDVMEGAKELKRQFYDVWNIKKGSKESALVQMFGEGEVSLEELKRQRPRDWEKFVEADGWARNFYDKWLKEVNRVRAAIYPNQPEKLIPARKDYYRHFRELESGFAGLRNIIESQAGIPSEMVGITEIVKPKSKFLSFAQKRLGMGEYERDAVGGMLDYLQAASYAKNIDPQIPRFRQLAKDLVEQTSEGGPNPKHLNNFIEYLNDFANDLSGKTNPIDRAVMKWLPGGRKTLRVLNWTNNRIKRNLIIMNASSGVSQFFNLPNGISDAGKKNSLEGFARYTKQVLGGIDADDPIKQSDFMRERYMSTAITQLDTGIMGSTRRFGEWLQRVGDKSVAQTIWNAEYIKATKAGIADAVKYADQHTEMMIAGRGVGEVPFVQKAIATQLIAPFQIEVNNAWGVMKDLMDEKRFSDLMTLLIANHVMNKGAEKVKGSAVVFDPIQAIYDAVKMKQPARVAGEVLSNVPFGQMVAPLVATEYGFPIPFTDARMPSSRELFGRQDPTRYGSGVLIGKGIEDPLFKLALPFGGSQLRKTVEGLKSYGQGFAESASGKRKFSTEQTLPNFLRSILFGQYSTPEAVEYFRKKDEGITSSSDRVRTPRTITTRSR